MSPLSKIYTFSLPLLLSFSIYNLSVHSPSIFASLTKDPLSLQHDSDFVGVSFLFLVVGMTLGSLLSNKKGDDGKSKSRSGLKKSSVVYPLEKIEACSSDKDKFVVMFETLKQQMLSHMSASHEMPPEACRWVGDMIQYNVIGGKLNRGITVLAVQRTLKSAKMKKSCKLTSLEVARASVLGWSIEWLQAFFLVADDVMDDSQTRRGQPCWYKRPEVGMIAINDSFLLESFIYTMLKMHFGEEEYYSRLRDLFLEVTQQTEFGQLLDLTSQPQGGPIDLNRFTETRYKQIVKYKTAFYTFYLPIAIGMITSGVTEERAYTQAKKICCIMGEYFQIQDDYLDCYGKPEDIGKIGTDIQDNKCSWLVVQALKNCSVKQRKVLEQNYGVWDDKKVKKVKQLYEELQIERMFKAYEEESYKEIQKQLESVRELPKEVFELLLKKIYKRSK